MGKIALAQLRLRAGRWMQAPDLTTQDGRPLAPDDNPAGPVAQSPTLLTSLSELPALENEQYEASAPGGLDVAAPISDVRVRVAGNVGMDALSRQRVLAVADSIHRETGLQVDIVDGSSPTAVSVAVPAGQHGRPALDLAEPWVEKGVATAVVSALDQKTVALAVMVLVACALAVGNAVSAGVRTRVTELGVLACLGWPRRRLFGLVLCESVPVGLVAGLGGTLLSLALAPLLGVHLEALAVLLALPSAVLLTLLGSVLGAGLGFTAAGFAGAVPLDVYLTVALVALGGVVLTVLAALVPAWSLRRLPTARLLAEE